MQTRAPQLIKAVAVLAVFVVIAFVISMNKPEVKRKTDRARPVLNVDSQVITPQRFQVEIRSFGTVQPRTQTLLVAQVSGQIVEVNPSFRDGGFFNKDDILIRIDDRDYQAAVKVAEAALLQAKVSLEEEKARAVQAERDWQRLGDGSPAPALVLRKPQLAAAEAQLISAQANFDKARLDLERTRIRAPYDGRVKTIRVDLGQFVNSSAQLADVFATDVVEIRLPLKNSELELVNLPENFRGKTLSEADYPHATIVSELGQRQEWSAQIVRTEAALDENSHQLYVVAQIKDPFAVQQSNKAPLKIGQYVTAKIEGKRVEQALVVPTSSLYQGSFVYVIKDGLLQRREVSLQFQTPEHSVLLSGIEGGEVLVTSPLGQVSSGTAVNDGTQAMATRAETQP
jgi:RND family efflux transporter MFP subunit